MEVRTLNYFLEAADTLNFTQAARNCFVTQTAISLAISKLEQELGVVLFHRNRRSVELTGAGEEFYRWARGVSRSYAEVVRRCQEIERGNVGHLNVGVNSSYDGFYMQELLERVDNRLEGIDINIRMGSVQSLLPKLRSHRIDVFLAPPFEYVEFPDLKVETLATYSLVVVMDSDHPFVAFDEVPISALRSQEAMVLTYQGLPNAESGFLKTLSEAGIALKAITQMNHIEEVLINLPNSDRVAILPSFIGTMLTSHLVTRPIKGISAEIPYAMVYLANAGNPVIGAVARALREQKG